MFARKHFVLGQYCPVEVKHDSPEELKGLYMAELVNFFVCAIVPVLGPNALEATDKVGNDVVRLNLSLPDIGSGGSVIVREKFWIPKSLNGKLFGLSYSLYEFRRLVERARGSDVGLLH